jgi:HlyD family secretion protein
MRARIWILALLFLAACGRQDDLLQGYAEADYIFVAPQDPGLVATLSVREGAEVRAGAPLFTLNPERARASYEAAEAQSRANRARAASQAIAQAEASAELAARDFARTQSLYERNFVSKVKLDQDRSRLDAARAEVRRLRAERSSAAQEDAAAEAQADLARTQLRDRAVAAPVAGRVERIFLRPGEFASVGEPVLALLPPGNLKIRFFAPERMLSQLRLGQDVSFSCDGCPTGLTARIFFIASEAQFTPPVIYSVEEREKLVYLVEARPNRPELLRPGQPLDVQVTQ